MGGREKLVEEHGEGSFLVKGACRLSVLGGTTVDTELISEDTDEVDFCGGSGLALSEDPDWNPLVTVLLGLTACTEFSLQGIKSSPNTEFESPSLDKESSSLPLSANAPLSSLPPPITVVVSFTYPLAETTCAPIAREDCEFKFSAFLSSLDGSSVRLYSFH